MLMRAVVVTSLLSLLPVYSASAAQPYPTKPIRVLVGFAPGGGADVVARLLAPKLQETFQQPIVVDNRTGAGSAIASGIAAKAAPDGYTLVLISSSHAINAGFPRKLPYDAVADFAGIAHVASTPLVLVANPALAVKSAAELIEAARAKPGAIAFASSGNGGISHLAGELLKHMAKVDLLHVPYKGAAPALADVMSGQVQLLFPSLPTTLPQIKSGRVRAIAVTSTKRNASLPDIPSIADSGVPGYEVDNWYGVLAPAATQRVVLDRLNATILQALRTADVKDAIARQGMEPVGSTPAEFQRYLKSETEKWARVIREAKITSD